jgi:hypothetical protein
MAVSKVDLANQALAHLSRDTIRDLDGSSPAAVHMKAHMQAAIEEVIEEYDWPQCRVISNLILASGVNLRDWTYAYIIPSDAVCVWRVANLRGDELSDFEIGMSDDLSSDTNYIFADDASLAVRYGSRRASLSRFTPQTVGLMALRLAAKACMPLTKNARLRQALVQEYKTEASAVKTRMANLEPEVIDTEFTPEVISVRSS